MDSHCFQGLKGYFKRLQKDDLQPQHTLEFLQLIYYYTELYTSTQYIPHHNPLLVKVQLISIFHDSLYYNWGILEEQIKKKGALSPFLFLFPQVNTFK